MMDEENATHAKLLAEYRALEEEYEGQNKLPEAVDARLGDLEMAMEKIETRPLIYDADEITRAGAFVTLDRHCALVVHCGYVRPEDEVCEAADVHSGEHVDVDRQGRDVSLPENARAGGSVVTSGGDTFGTQVPEDRSEGDTLKPLPERLLMELSAHRTLALREAVGRFPDVALTLLLLRLVNDTFRTSGASGRCCEASVRHVYMSAQASDLAESVAAKLVEDRHTEWETDLPLGDDAALWVYLAKLDQGSRLSLRAHKGLNNRNEGSHRPIRKRKNHGPL